MILRVITVGLVFLLASAAADSLDFDKTFNSLSTCWRDCVAQYSNCDFLDLICYCAAAQDSFLADTVTCARNGCGADASDSDPWLDTLNTFCGNFGSDSIPSGALSSASACATAKPTSTTEAHTSKTERPASTTTTESKHTTEGSRPSSTSKSSPASATAKPSSNTIIPITSSSAPTVAITSSPVLESSALVPDGGVVTSYVQITLPVSSSTTTPAINPQETNGSPFLGQPGSDAVRTASTLGLKWLIVGIGMALGMGMFK